ncbi:kinesin-like protein KIN-12C [Iris pallida]|uniref:Kinesin-like protein KIN-12C n=1 Tax=Iris pallida TaxID=29817 RepID=A0AAX6DPV9_IRIPA|nr:kinesin-like protein KIN-12C [Iris pallida]
METLNLTPSDLAGSNSSMSPLLLRRTRSDQENTPPLPIDHPNVHRTTKLEKTSSSPEIPAHVSHSPPRDAANSVKVVVRVRPVNRREREGVRIVHKDSSASLSVEGQTFHFDSVLGPDSSQEDVFMSVGVPLVESSLAGFNATVLSYGQTGSGKTYTMWGPPSAMLDGRSINSYQGLVPRIFQTLFSEIQKKQESSEQKQVNYQCRCSFLEIYNEQINDLLDPTQRNLQIQGDPRAGFHVENLTDEYVTTIEDVTHILVKGLSNRKVGATSVNSKSSRSHIVFTCILESWCKGSSSIFSSSKSSRISLVDLAGIDMDTVDGVGKHCLKEAKHIKQSLSKLGKVVTLLATVSQPGKDQNIPYKDSCLTHLLQDTLGGNAKVTFICAISPNDRHKAGTLSTLRFGERARLVQNKALINEITEDDVNGLSDQIRQLKEELIREKSYVANSASNYVAYFKGKKARESLNLLRVSLNRSLILPRIDNDSKEELVVDEEDVMELCSQLTNLHSSGNENSEDIEGTSPSELIMNGNLDKDVNSCLGSLEAEEHSAESSLEDIISEVHNSEAPSNGTALHSEMVSHDTM